MEQHTGDDGRSDLIGPDRPSKADPVFECLGWIDELNTALGMLRVEIRDDRSLSERENLDRELRSIQVTLGEIMGAIAWNREEKQAGLPHDEVIRIGSAESALRNAAAIERRFYIPGDGPRTAALADAARSRCRTAERSLVALMDISQRGNLDTSLFFLNRLSDYLFALVRTLESENA